MKCWGNDVFGQIGNGLPPDRIGPTLVQNFLEPRKRRTRTPVPTLTAIAADTTTPQPVETTDTPLPETATPTLIPGTTPSTPIPTEIATATPAGATATPQVDPPRFANIYAPLIMKGFPIFFDGPNEVEDNDTAISANGPMRLNTNYLGRPDDANDYFRFVLPRDGTVTISLIGHIAENTQNMQLQLRSASDTSIQFVFQKPFAIQRALPAGTYLVRVFYAPPGPYSTATPYTLRIGFE